MKEKQLWMIGAIGAIVAIWLSVLLVSLFSPDLVSGSQQEHLPLAAIVTWISGALATRSVLRIIPRSEGEWMVASLSATALWAAVAIVGIFVPPVLTGSDPTRIPLAAILAPIGGAIVTGMPGRRVGNQTEVSGSRRRRGTVCTADCL
jgi:hypothetical protein